MGSGLSVIPTIKVVGSGQLLKAVSCKAGVSKLPRKLQLAMKNSERPSKFPLILLHRTYSTRCLFLWDHTPFLARSLKASKGKYKGLLR